MFERNPSKWVHILPNAELSYRESDIQRFIGWWNEGYPISYIAQKLNVKKTDVALLAMHCEIEGMIEPRPGGLLGTISTKWIRAKSYSPKKGMGEQHERTSEITNSM